MRKPRAVLFDWDNTLVESWDIIHESLRLTFLDLDREPWTFKQTRAPGSPLDMPGPRSPTYSADAS